MRTIREGVRAGLQDQAVDPEAYLTMNEGAREVIEGVPTERPGDFGEHMSTTSFLLVVISVFALVLLWAHSQNKRHGRVGHEKPSDTSLPTNSDSGGEDDTAVAATN